MLMDGVAMTREIARQPPFVELIGMEPNGNRRHGCGRATTTRQPSLLPPIRYLSDRSDSHTEAVVDLTG